MGRVGWGHETHGGPSVIGARHGQLLTMYSGTETMVTMESWCTPVSGVSIVNWSQSMITLSVDMKQLTLTVLTLLHLSHDHRH